jgi:membrane peptidoglycan carboxypeptidase
MKKSSPKKRPSLDLEKPDKKVFNSTDSLPNEPDNLEIINEENNSPQMLALPSEMNSRPLNHILAEDGYIKSNSLTIIKKSAKIGNEFNSNKVNLDDIESKSSSKLGRKSIKSWSSNVDDLKRKLGFSWQKMTRKFAIFLIFIVGFSALSVAGVATLAVSYWDSTPDISRILERNSNQSSVVYARDGKTKIFEFYKEERREIIDNLDEIPVVMQLAVISLEEENYWDESNTNGIPWRNIAGATRDCFLTAGDNCRGASGISQQLIKNITGDDERSPDRKLRELVTAVKLNEAKSKSDILKDYLNWVPFGRNAYGVQEASKQYFGRPVNTRDEKGNFVITPPEACYLASMIQSPSYYASGVAKLPQANQLKFERNNVQMANQGVSDNPTVQGDVPNASFDLESRKDACLTKLNEINFVTENNFSGKIIETEEELERLIRQPIASTKSLAEADEVRRQGRIAFVNLKVEDPFPHFREYITKELEKYLPANEIYEQGYDIITTLDPNLQKESERIIKANEGLVKSAGGDNASGVVIDGPTGEVLAMVGSFGYDREDIDGKVNIATSPQQPGSSIKPYVYAAAFQNGFNPATVINDVQTTWQGYTPKNFDNTFRGPVSMRRAFQGSLNIPAVKSLFLVNDDPQWNQESKLNTFFNFTESTGVVFPCVEGASNAGFSAKNSGVETCKVNPTKDISQAEVDAAYRGRCFIASSLGGCELTLISHTAGINTFLQEGKKMDARPFISVKRRQDGTEILQKKLDANGNIDYYFFQGATKNINTPDQIAYDVNIPNPDDEIVTVSRQVNNVMSDYQSRVPEFGPLRFNLELNDKRWRIAAKTGTSNGPRDFWTVGGTPLYSISIWAGTTDNRAMNSSASSGRVAALIWKDLMEMTHKGKQPVNFSTEGLTRTFVSGGSKIEENPDGTKKTTPVGQTEFLTKKQIQQLRRRSGVVAITSQAEIDQLKKKTIFENRTTTVEASYFINSIDKGLFVAGVTPESNKQAVSCIALLPEFPEPNWSTPIENWVNKNDAFCKFPEPSNSSQVVEPIFTTNIQSNQIFSGNQINFSASFPNNSLQISRVEIQRNGTSVGSANTNSININTAPFNKTTANYLFIVTDQNGKTYQISVTSVTIDTDKLTIADITNINCQAGNTSSTTNCSFNITPQKDYQSLNMRIGNAAIFNNCVVAGSAVNCNGVSTPAAPNPNTPITIIIDGVGYGSGVTVSIT